MKNMDFYINGFGFQQTCVACPEQYDVFDVAGNLVAYFRLRHGNFRVECPDVGGDQVYCSSPKGDGVFEPDERERYLREAIAAVESYYINKLCED